MVPRGEHSAGCGAAGHKSYQGRRLHGPSVQAVQERERERERGERGRERGGEREREREGEGEGGRERERERERESLFVSLLNV